MSAYASTKEELHTSNSYILELIFRKCTKKLAHSILFATLRLWSIVNKSKNRFAVEFKHFNEDFDTSLRSRTALLESAIEKVMASTGKKRHIRPLLLLLTAKSLRTVTENSINSAVLIELLHTATLIHDDVIDETKDPPRCTFVKRHLRQPYLCAGGWLHSLSALVRSIMTADLRVISIVSNLGRSLSEGEIKQLNLPMKSSSTRKTICKSSRKRRPYCSLRVLKSGYHLGSTTRIHRKSRLFGECLGYAFQIKDDIFDYFNDSNIGKPTGNDIREGKITLPLLHAIQTATPQEANSCLDIIKSRSFLRITSTILSPSPNMRGIDYATRRMNFYQGSGHLRAPCFPRFTGSWFVDDAHRLYRWAFQVNIFLQRFHRTFSLMYHLISFTHETSSSAHIHLIISYAFSYLILQKHNWIRHSSQFRLFQPASQPGWSHADSRQFLYRDLKQGWCLEGEQRRSAGYRQDHSYRSEHS